MKAKIVNELEAHIETYQKVKDLIDPIQEVASIAINALKKGNKILVFGNGGSAADAQHFAAELTGRYKKERRGLPAIALTTDTSAITAIGNDYGYDRVFDRQVEALAQKGDILIGISTSGNSQNVLNAFKVGSELGCTNIGFSGRDGGKMNDFCQINLIAPSNDTPRIQEVHIFLVHTLCDLIENAYI